MTVCGLGTVTRLEGINCYHERYPFVPGISERQWSDEWLANKNMEENTPREYHGKTYTVYETKQRQRQMETAMRAQREKVRLLQAGGADPEEITVAKAKYQGQLNEYARFSRKMGLKQERDRIYLDMRGRVALSTDRQREIESWLENMYNKGDLLKNIKIYEADVEIRKRIRSGNISTKIHGGKQGKHIKGHNNYIPGRSYLTISETEIQELVRKYAGSGWIRRDHDDKWVHKEIVTADHIIGVVVNPETGVEEETRKFVIHYAGNGVHIVPAREER